MAYDKNKFEDNILDFVMDGFDETDIKAKNNKTDLFINSLAELSKQLESPDVSEIKKRQLKGWFDNISMAYKEEITKFINYAEENLEKLPFSFNTLQAAKSIAGVSIAKAEEGASILTNASHDNKSEPLSDASTEIDNISDFSESKNSQSTQSNSSLSEKSQISIKSRNIFQRIFDNIKDVFKSKPETANSNLSSMAKMMEKGVVGTKRTREDKDDPTIGIEEPVSKKAKTNLVHPKPVQQEIPSEPQQGMRLKR